MYNLKNMAEDKLIKLNVSSENPEEIIKIGGELLLKNDIVTDSYVQAMIEAYRELGSYIVIAPNIAMPHTSGENGALKTGVSLLTLSKPVSFGNEYNDPVFLVFCIANAGEHEELLPILESIVKIGSDDTLREQFRNAGSIDDIEKIINNFNL